MASYRTFSSFDNTVIWEVSLLYTTYSEITLRGMRSREVILRLNISLVVDGIFIYIKLIGGDCKQPLCEKYDILNSSKTFLQRFITEFCKKKTGYSDLMLHKYFRCYKKVQYVDQTISANEFFIANEEPCKCQSLCLPQLSDQMCAALCKICRSTILQCCSCFLYSLFIVFVVIV